MKSIKLPESNDKSANSGVFDQINKQSSDFSKNEKDIQEKHKINFNVKSQEYLLPENLIESLQGQNQDNNQS